MSEADTVSQDIQLRDSCDVRLRLHRAEVAYAPLVSDACSAVCRVTRHGRHSLNEAGRVQRSICDDRGIHANRKARGYNLAGS